MRHGHDLRSLLEAATSAGTRATGAEYGAFFYSDRDEGGERLELFVLSGADARDFPTTLPVRSTPLFAPTFEGTSPIRVADVATDPRFGHGASGGLPPVHPPVRSYLAAPVLSGTGRVIGALLFAHSRPDRFDADAEAAAVAAAAGAAVTIDNALLVAEERAAREMAEDREAVADASATRFALLQQITALLSTSATRADITDAVPVTITHVLGCASAAVFLLDDSRDLLVGTSHPPLEEAAGVGVVPLRADTPPTVAVRNGQPVVFTAEDARRLFDGAVDPAALRSGLAVPMFGREGCVGALVAHWTDASPPSGSEVDLFASIAAQVALALERAQLLDAERAARESLALSVSALTDLARTLQRGLLPRSLPVLDRVAIAVRYQPAVVGAEVGGDWYDAVETDSGVVFVIGDVQGHNTTAAGLMGQLRTAVRAYLTEGHGPGAALERTNRLLADLGEELFATCCLVSLDQQSGEVVVASAGHPAPLVSDERGLWELEVDPGPPLGIAEGAEYPSTTHRLRGRSCVVLYTDGVVESPLDQLTAGEASLRRTIAEAPDASCEVLATQIMANIPHRLDDDAAMLVLEYGGATTVPEEAVLPLPSDVRAVAQARSFLRTVLGTWGAPHLADAGELVLSELVTNALLHTGGEATVVLRFERSEGRLNLGVRDGSTRHPRGRHADDDALGGRGLAIVEALAAEWGVSVGGEGKTVWADLVA
nr:SpoIIE family protein phosphatase [Kineococcus siccus]